MPSINNLKKRLRSYLTEEQISQVVRAYYFAEKAHEGQYRRSGDPYITHPLAVANILVDMHMDYASLMAAMLHDVIEDTGVSKEQLAEAFSEEVAELVDGVSKIAQIKFESKAEQQAENLRKMMLAMTRDIRVILVKLADRLHNMRTLHVMRAEKRKRIATETLEIYAPIAFRLGMYNMRVEYEDLAFHNIHPMRARLIGKAVQSARGNRREILSSIKTSLERSLEEEGIQARVLGREKHLYSIYQKMKEQHKPFADIMDVFGFRIIVDRVDTCYRVLGAVHNHFIPIPGRFKDYVAIPKANGYQSLHTTLKAHSGIPLEIQIRTEEMEAMANNGIAAHWLYKSHDEPGSPTHTRAQSWMKRLLEIQQKAGNSMEFIENVKVDLFPDEAYVFTPKGDIKELPAGATPVDFAYHIHTEVGHRCRGAKVNGHIVPLNYNLQTGEQVEILTAKEGGPSRDWMTPSLGYVATSSARARIQQWFKRQDRDVHMAQGRAILEREISRLALDRIDLDALAPQLNLKTGDDVLAALGAGDLRPGHVVNQAQSLLGDDPQQELAFVPARSKASESGDVTIQGVGNLLTHMAACCRPVPGDQVMGFITQGRGVTVHRADCHNLLAMQGEEPNRVIEVSWGEADRIFYPVDIFLRAWDRQGLLRDVIAVLANEKVNVTAVHTESHTEDNTATMLLTLEIASLGGLGKVLAKMDQLKGVLEVRRYKK